MRILVVGRPGAELEQRADCLRTLYPRAEVVADYDSMSAVQYAFNHAVDAVYTEVQTRPISGFDVVRLVRKQNPGALTHLVAETDAYLNRAAEMRLDGYYLLPTDMESLRRGNLLRWDKPPGQRGEEGREEKTWDKEGALLAPAGSAWADHFEHWRKQP